MRIRNRNKQLLIDRFEYNIVITARFDFLLFDGGDSIAYNKNTQPQSTGYDDRSFKQSFRMSNFIHITKL